MKAIAVFALCLCLSITWTGCAPPQPDTSSIQFPDFSVSEVSEDTLATDGTVIFTKTYQKIQIPSALDGVMADLQCRIDNLLADAEEIESFAREDYAAQADWTAYFAKIRCSVMRQDETVLSLYLEYSSFSGGSHPTLSTYSVSYDIANDEPLSLEKVLAEGCSVKQLSIPVNAALSEISDQLYDDYEAIVGNLFYNSTEGIRNWYLSEKGLCFHFAPYQIAPYAMGPITATIPYSDLTEILRAEYLPK